jgi:hypothetical protein
MAPVVPDFYWFGAVARAYVERRDYFICGVGWLVAAQAANRPFPAVFAVLTGSPASGG